jgi:hypothetical protein
MTNPTKIPILLLIFLLLLSVIHARKLKMIHEIFRHGSRYPIYVSEKDSAGYASIEMEVGELTPQGKHMQYILGKAMYDKYWTQLFEGTPYIDKYHPTQFYVKSTNVNRTI